MDPIRVCLAGATGSVGRMLAPAIISSPDMKLVGAVSRSSAGRNLGDILGTKEASLIVSGSVEQALAHGTDVMVDYTSPDCVKSNVLSAVRNRVHAVVGTSGLSDSDYEEIDSESKKYGVGVIAAGNFALSAALLLHFATTAAKYMTSWEVIDYASWTKVDAPSGTARELAHRLSEVGPPESRVSAAQLKGPAESRGLHLNGTQVHSVRLPGHAIGAEVLFGREGDERLSMRYDGGKGAESYIDGTMLAIRRVAKRVGLTRGLDRLLDLGRGDK